MLRHHTLNVVRKLKMDTKNYKRIVDEGNVLDYGTLKFTIQHLEKSGHKSLVIEIERIIKENKIEKPSLHNKQNSKESEYFKVDLGVSEIEMIVSILGDLETGALGVDYEPTRAASLYASMLDRWNDLPDYR